MKDLCQFVEDGGGHWRAKHPQLPALSATPIVRSRVDPKLGPDAPLQAVEDALEHAIEQQLAAPYREAALDHLGLSPEGRKLSSKDKREALAARHWGWEGSRSYRRNKRDEVLRLVAEALVDCSLYSAPQPMSSPSRDAQPFVTAPSDAHHTPSAETARTRLERLERTWRYVVASNPSDDQMRMSLATAIGDLLEDRELTSDVDIALVRKRLALGDALSELGDPRVGLTSSDEDWAIGALSLVPPGPFLAGSDPQRDADAFPNESPGTQATVSYSYYLAVYPVTVYQYLCFLRAADGYSRRDNWRHGPAADSATRNRLLAELETSALNHPATNISWFEASAYCVWLTRRFRERQMARLNMLPDLPGRATVRLPTEFEWEKAARGPTGRRYAWPDDTHSSFRLDRRLVRRGTTAVGLFTDELSPYGAMDLIGNVWEWCTGEYALDSSIAVSVSTPTPPGAPAPLVPVRGGGHGPDRRMLRAACRFGVSPSENAHDRGFRVVVA